MFNFYVPLCLFEIIGLDEKKSFLLYELENNPEKLNKIKEFLFQIRKELLALSKIGNKRYRILYILNAYNIRRLKRPYLTIIRKLTEHKYDMIKELVSIEENGVKIRTRKYTFVEKICFI